MHLEVVPKDTTIEAARVQFQFYVKKQERIHDLSRNDLT